MKTIVYIPVVLPSVLNGVVSTAAVGTAKWTDRDWSKHVAREKHTQW